jgi:MFS family permease
MAKKSVSSRNIINAAIIVAALGYFVDIYDLVLFSIVRVPSLKALGVPDVQLMDTGAWLLTIQMWGMLVGGILWGILGDVKGRLSVLFGSIFLYSIANLANGMVHSIDMYAVLRFVAGVGLAGELGAGITLVSESMPKETRGYGTMIVASIGILGAVVASLVGDFFDWRIAYYVGGGLGLLLLGLRVGVYESGMFTSLKGRNVSRGNILLLFSNARRTIRYLSCILIGVPMWFMVGILITFSPEFGKAMGMAEAPSAGKAIMYCYIGLAIGDFISGSLSQYLGTRKKVVFYSILVMAAGWVVYFTAHGLSLAMFYALCVALGLGGGYWAVFVTIASEQFGTNIRATVTTTVPNFVRGAVPLLIFLFQHLKPGFGIVGAAAAVGFTTVAIALVALMGLEETHAKELNYLEGVAGEVPG